MIKHMKTVGISDIDGNFYPIPTDTPGYQYLELKTGWNSLYLYEAGSADYSEIVIHTMSENMTDEWMKKTVEVNNVFGKTMLTCIDTVDNRKGWIGDRILITYMPHKATMPNSYYIIMIYTSVETGFYINCVLRN